MDYEKKYNEVLAWAKKYKARLNGVPIEEIFPELRESEDERTRKELVEKITNLACGCFISQEQKQKFIAYLEKQEEQKPAEKQDYFGLNDLERAIHRGFLSAGVENVPVTIIKETAQECLAEMKPAEWSEEDEDMINCCISSIEEAKENRYAYKETDGDTSYDREIAFLKSLRPRPSWKPSEEQEEPEYYQHFDPDC